MSDIDPLEKIVVEISRDGKTGMGTGFYISKDEIATCYHVLVPQGSKRKKNYWIRHDNDASLGWQKATLLRYLPLPQDVAILKTSRRLESFDANLLCAWNRKPSKFVSRGYSDETSNDVGIASNQIDGQIIADTFIYDTSFYPEKSRRLQLQTKPEAIKFGRSGSPVFSSGQNAVIGMIDYQGGPLHRDAQIVAAILIESIVSLGELQQEDGRIVDVPELPAHFLSRPAELNSIKNALMLDNRPTTALTSISRVGVHGMGGIGKSILAAATARDEQIRRVFKDGIIWIGLGQQADPLQSQINLIRALEPAHGPVENISEGRKELERILRDKCCLIILDDVWRMEQLQAFDGLGPGGRTLLTTRDQAIVRNARAVECCLGVLTDREAQELLKMSSGRKDLPHQALGVVMECENLPLALAMVGSMVKGRPDDRWENVLHKLRSADLERIRAEFNDCPYPNLMKAIEISTEGLEADHRKLYLDLAVFPKDEQVPEGALQVLWNADRYDTQDLVDLFVDRSLAILKNGRLSVHDLQHDFMIKRSGDLLKLHEKIREGYKSKCSDGWSTGPNDGYFFQRLIYHLFQANRLVSRQSSRVVKFMMYYLHNQPRRIGYEEVHCCTF